MKNSFSVAKVLAAAATLVLLTSGCMQAEVGVVVKDDGSADLKMRMVVSMDTLESMAADGWSMGSSSDSSSDTTTDFRRELEAGLWSDETLYCRLTEGVDPSGVPSYDGTLDHTCDSTPCDDPVAATTTTVPGTVTTCFPPSGSIAATTTAAPTTTAPLDKAALCAQMRKEQGGATTFPAGIVVTEILDDKWCGWEITGTAKNTQEILTTLTAMSSIMDDDEDDTPPTADSFVLAKDTAGGWSLLLKDPFSCPSDGESSDAAAMEAMFGAMMADFKVTYNFQLPGVPSTNNATSVNGNTFTWAFSMAEMTAFCKLPDHDFHALTTPGVVAATADASTTSSAPGDSDGGGSTLKILLSVAALAAAGAGGFVLKRRRDYGYTDTAVQTSVAPAQMAPVWDAAANAWAATGPDGIAYLYDQQTSQWVPRR